MVSNSSLPLSVSSSLPHPPILMLTPVSWGGGAGWGGGGESVSHGCQLASRNQGGNITPTPQPSHSPPTPSICIARITCCGVIVFSLIILTFWE